MQREQEEERQRQIEEERQDRLRKEEKERVERQRKDLEEEERLEMLRKQAENDERLKKLEDDRKEQEEREKTEQVRAYISRNEVPFFVSEAIEASSKCCLESRKTMPMPMTSCRFSRTFQVIFFTFSLGVCPQIGIACLVCVSD